jgi:fucose permease
MRRVAEAAPTAPVRGRDVTLLAAFCSLGIVSATIPASIPASAVRLGVGAEKLLPAVSFLFLGLLIGVLVTVVPRSAARVFLLVGLLLEAAGLAFVAAAPTVPVFFLGSGLAGVGFGLAEASATSLTRLHSAERTPGRLAVLNGATAVAAAVTPLVLAASASVSAQALTVAALGTVPVAGAVVTVSMWSRWPAPTRAPRADAAVPRNRSATASRGLILAGAALFLFVGAETVLAGWSSVLPQALFQLSPEAAALGTTVFWLLMAAGRFLCAAILRRGIRAELYLSVVVIAAALLVTVAAFAPGVVAGVLTGLVVVLVAPGYALLLGRALVGVTAHAAGRVTGWLLALGAAGGTVISYGVAVMAGTAPVAVLCSIGVVLAGCGALSVIATRRTTGGPPDEAAQMR